jgi:hypothetical protein
VKAEIAADGVGIVDALARLETPRNAKPRMLSNPPP